MQTIKTYKTEKTIDRWFTLPDRVIDHPSHKAWRHTKNRFCTVPAGRRSYKSEWDKRKLVSGSKYHHGALTKEGIYIYAAPTMNQVRRIAFDALRLLSKPFWAGQPNLTNMEIYLQNGSQIWCVGMDAPERIEGIFGLGGMVLDEMPNMKSDVWDYHIQPMSIDNPDSWFDLIGVPDGKNHYYELAQKGIRGEPNWGNYSWKTADIVDWERVMEAKRSLPIKAFRQEYEASFEDTYGIVYYAYTKDNETPFTFKPNLHTYLCFDFNISPMSCILVQEFNNKYYCVKEFIYTNNTLNHGLDIKDWLLENNFEGNLELTGDFTGNSRKTSASADYTDWSILEDIFKNFKNYRAIYMPCDRHKTRTNALNAMFRNSLDEISMYVNIDECPFLHKDLLKVQWKEGGSQILKKSWLSDMSDALSYFAMNHHGMGSKIQIIN